MRRSRRRWKGDEAEISGSQDLRSSKQILRSSILKILKFHERTCASSRTAWPPGRVRRDWCSSTSTGQGRRHVQFASVTVPGRLIRSRQPNTSWAGSSRMFDEEAASISRRRSRVASSHSGAVRLGRRPARNGSSATSAPLRERSRLPPFDQRLGVVSAGRCDREAAILPRIPEGPIRRVPVTLPPEHLVAGNAQPAQRRRARNRARFRGPLR